MQVDQKLKVARAELEKAEEFARSHGIAGDRLSRVIDETRNLARPGNGSVRGAALAWRAVDVRVVLERVRR